MRIGICGAQGTGKTTLAHQLAKRLELPLIGEQAREVVQLLNVKRPRDLRDKQQAGVAHQTRCLLSQVKAEEIHERGFVSDRTFIDNAVYFNKWHAHQVTSSFAALYYEMCRQQAKRYDLVVYIPPEIPIEDDQFRSIDVDYQAEIDFLVRVFLNGLLVKSWIKVTGTVESRMQQVLRWVDIYKGESGKCKID